MVKYFKNTLKYIFFVFFFTLSLFGSFIVFINIDLSYSFNPLRYILTDNKDAFLALEGKHIARNHLVLNNSMGASSFMYRGQKKIGAFFGACSFQQKYGFLDNAEQFTEELSRHFDDLLIHNFSRDEYTCRVISEKLKRINKKFDYIFISNFCLDNETWGEKLSKRMDFQRPSNPKKYITYFFQRIQNKVKDISLDFSSKRDSKVSYSKDISKEIGKQTIIEYQGPPKPFPKFDKNNRVVARWYRNQGKIKLISKFETDSESIYMQKISAARKMFKEAMKYSKKVYFITTPIAFDEREVSGVAERWLVLPDIGMNNNKFVDNASEAFNVRKNLTKAASDVAKQMSIKVIDLDSFLRAQLRVRNDLFYDHSRLTPQGARLAAKFVYNEINASK